MNEPTERNWQMGCGTCGSNFHMVNAAIVRVGDGCDHCAQNLTTGVDGGPWVGLVQAEAGWCGCGDVESLDRAMSAFLNQPPEATDGFNLLRAADTLEGQMIALLANDLGWVEHGTSSAFSWPTDDGRTAAANLAAHVQRMSTDG